MNKTLGTIAAAALLVVAVTLAVAVAAKQDHTAVSAQPIAPIQVVTTDPDAARKPADVPLAVFIGDFVGGSNEGGKGDANWTALVGAALEKSRPLRIAVDTSGGGSGYVVRGTNQSFPDQVRRMVNREARIVTISGSRNDVVADPQAVAAGAQETYQLIRTLAPRATLIAIGPTWGVSTPSEQVLATRDAVAEAAAAAGAIFVDPLEDQWFTKGEQGLIAPDNVHPTNLGNTRIAEYMFAIYAQVVAESEQQPAVS